MIVERLALASMGTRFELVLVDAVGSGRGLRAAGEAALEVIDACDRRWSAFRRDSLVSRIRREAEHRPVRVDAETFRLLEASLELWQRTAGRFDVGLGGAMQTLGFRGSAARGARFESRLEPPLTLDERHSTVSMRPDSPLDLGGVAKGCALDLAALELTEAGVDCALLHGGTSSVLALGSPPLRTEGERPAQGERPGWRVSVPDPTGGAPDLVAVLADASLSISAPHGRTASAPAGEAPGEPGPRHGHVLDPHTGRSAELGRLACVVSASGLEADGLATALVAGAGDGENAARLLRPGAACALVAGPLDQRRWAFSGAHETTFETRIPQTT